MKNLVALTGLAVALATPAFAQQIGNFNEFRSMALMSNAFEVKSSQIALEKSRNPRVRDYAREMIRDHRAANVALLGGRETVARGTGIGGLIEAPFAIAGGAVGAATGAAAGVVGGTLQGGPVGGLEGLGTGAARGAQVGANAVDLDGDVTTTAATQAVPLSPQQQAMLAELADTPAGPAFDRTYARMQVQAHSMTVANYQAYAQTGPNPALRSYVQQALPVMQQHLAMAQRLPGAR
ncbi:DUF4142 domain-containing protein [Methylobacterium nonmethylotrophicum]|uniref:DUF4142 domain-containing protein n=1 Tax=Methylobacterium nonmethylotrophicum TaxID=1141884 RepID=A0A4Z0NJQ3_9HYPH|nr:DUF4142 domain-containing protein [Methylobacterium nonmethylotrophicum]TGD95986.1 DUF4142 domain-containing protein [Methylobacterium nonmethylotrophicum]